MCIYLYFLLSTYPCLYYIVDLKKAGLPKCYQEHKQTLNIDKGKWKEESKDVYYHGHNSPTKKTY